MVYETQFHVWFGTWTHGVKLFLWVRGSQSVISHEVCVSQSCLHWIIQYLSFNDIWIGICMRTVQWIDERRQTNFWFLAEWLGWGHSSAHCGIGPPWAPHVQCCPPGQVAASTSTVACHSFSLWIWATERPGMASDGRTQECHHGSQEINPLWKTRFTFSVKFKKFEKKTIGDSYKEKGKNGWVFGIQPRAHQLSWRNSLNTFSFTSTCWIFIDNYVYYSYFF